MPRPQADDASVTIKLQPAAPFPKAVLKRVPKEGRPRGPHALNAVPDEYMEGLHLDNGYLPGKIGARKLTPAMRDNKLKLAETSSSIINYDTLTEDFPHLHDVLAPVRDPDAFAGLFVSGEPRTRRPLSRDMKQHEESLHEFDIVEPYAASSLLLEMASFAVWCVLFLVPKKVAGLGRLVVDAREVNRAQKKPGDMGLVRLHDLIRKVLSFSHASKSDGRSYFYQFLLHADIRPFFRARLASWRGSIVEVMLKRMPMGWSWSPRIAQQVSNAVVYGLGLAWLDDFIIGGKDEEEFLAAADEFRRRVRRYNVDMDDLSLEPSTTLEAVGLEFDLKAKRYRLSPKWVASKNLQPVTAAEIRTLRDWFRLFGALVWADHAANSPLFRRAEALAALSHLARLAADDFDKPSSLPDYAVNNINEWITEVNHNVWREAPVDRPASPDAMFFSDASGHTNAWVRIAHDTITQGEQWATDDDRHIFLKEMEALLASMASASPEDLRNAAFVTDNAASNYALRRGHSSSYTANTMMRATLGRARPWSIWTPTDKMIADAYTRGVKLPTHQARLSADQQVSLLHAQRLWGSEIEAKSLASQHSWSC